jgi:hypothetical protein
LEGYGIIKNQSKMWKAGEDDGDEDAGDESSGDDAADVVDNDSGDNNRSIECNEPSSHSCQRCKRCVCSICCNTLRGLEMTWWCEECFKKQRDWNQLLIRKGTYSSGDEIRNERN